MLRFLFVTLLLAAPVHSPALADTVSIGQGKITTVESLPVTVTSSCLAYNKATYPGDWNMLIACPNLTLENVRAQLASAMAGKTILNVVADDTMTSEFLIAGEATADDLSTLRGIKIAMEGPVLVDARLHVLVSDL